MTDDIRQTGRGFPSPKASGTILKKIKMGDVTALQCPQTGGLWFDVEDWERVQASPLNSLKKMMPTKTAPELDKHRGVCPKCGSTAQLIAVRDLILELSVGQCKVCNGRWVDGSTLLEYGNRKGGFLARLLGWFRR